MKKECGIGFYYNNNLIYLNDYFDYVLPLITTTNTT